MQNNVHAGENLSKENKLFLAENNSLKSENYNLHEKLQSLRAHEMEMQTQLNISKKELNCLEAKINEILATIKSIAVKSDVFQHVNKIFDNCFAQKIRSFTNYFSKTFENNLLFSLQNIEDWIKLNSFQMQVLQDKVLSREENSKEQKTKLTRLEKSLCEYSKFEQDKIAAEKEYALKINKLEGDNKLLSLTKLDLEKELERLTKDFNELKIKNINKIKEANDTFQQLNELKICFENMEKENLKVDKNFAFAAFQMQALEERIKIILKEKKYYENTLTQLGSFYPIKNLTRIINDILNTCDSICLLERDRLKIIQTINNVEYEAANEKADTMIINSLLTEKEKNLKFLNEYNLKIGNFLS